MFETWLELDQRPFGAAPFAGHYFAAEAIDAARGAIHRCVERGAGPAIVIGSAGSGKSMLALVLQHEICPLAPFALVSGGELHSRREMLQSLLYEFGLPYRGEQESELRLDLLDFFTSRDASQRASVLVVDDAHFLSPELLHDLANLSSHARDGNWCLQLVLLGTLRLEELLTTPSLASFQQRIASRSYLTNWTLAETTAYIRGQVEPLSAKWNEFPTLSESVCRKVYEFTSGTPRLVNQLCEHVLMSVLVTGQGKVTIEEVEQAWYDVQHLPAPAHLSSKPKSQRATPPCDQELIEFGELTDDDNVPTTPYRVSEIQAKLDQVQDGLDFIVNSESSPMEVQSAKTVPMERPVVIAENPFTEHFAEEVLVLIPAPLPRTGIVTGIVTRPSNAPQITRTGIVSGEPVCRGGIESGVPEVGTVPDFQPAPSSTVSFVDATDGLTGQGGNSFQDAMALLSTNFASLSAERPTERAIAPISGRRYRHLFSRLNQGA